MAAKTFLAYFYDERAADAAAKALQTKIYIVALKKYEADVPDPDLSVSALMVGFLPNLAHGIFGTDDAGDVGAYLLIVVDEHGHDAQVRDIVERFGGSVIKEES